MILKNPSFISFDGKPITGRVPPQLRVDGGQALTQQQAGQVAHAYKLFRDVVSVAITPYVVQNRVLADGTRVRMESLQGRDIVYVWPGGEGSKTVSLRGFVVLPKAIAGHTLSERLKKSILTVIDKLAKWGPFIYGYNPGADPEPLKYSVSGTAFDGKVRNVGISKFITWVGKSVRNFHPISDDKYNDVFAVNTKTLYKNGVAAKSFGAGPPGGTPVVYTDGTPAMKVVFVDNEWVSAVSEGVSPAVVRGYDWRAFADPYAMLAAQTFNPGVEIDFALSGGTKKARYLSYNKTSAGAIQVCIATAALSPDAPYASIVAQEMNQLNVETALNAVVGWVTADALPTAAPIIGTPTARSMLIGHYYSSLSGGVYAGEIASNDLYMGVTVPNTANGTDTFIHTHSIPESVKINETEYASIVRESSISSVIKRNSVTYFNTWSEASPLLTGGSDPLLFTAGSYFKFGLSFGGPRIYEDQPVTGAYTEVGSVMTHNDTATCHVAIPGIPEKIYEVTATHHIEGATGTGTSIELGTNAGTSMSSTATVEFWLVFVKNDASFPTLQQLVYENVSRKLGANSFTAKARDYLYSDRHNEVFVWVEAEIVSASTNEALDTGTSSITVKTCVQFNGTKHYTTIYSATYTTPREVPKMTPWGIMFASTECSWDYIAPQRPDPIYAPQWRDQGLCPYIAYTTKEEMASGVVPRIAVHFRTLLYRSIRGVMDPEVPEHSNVVAFPIYMCEQLMSNWGVPPRPVIDTFEATPTIIKLTLPDTTLFANIGAPLSDATEYAKFYRT